MKLAICPTCTGFLPPSVACPHCQASAPKPSRALRLLKKTLMVAGGGAMTMTIAACYGAPCAADSDCSPEPIDSIAVTGESTVAAGATVQLLATATHTDAVETDVTLSATWTTNSSNIATVASGLVSGVAPGDVVVTAEQEGVSGSATITVTTAGAFTVSFAP